MKTRLLPLILLLLLASCTITKRKYLPGYAINWVHKTPERMVASKQEKSGNIVNGVPVSLRPHQMVLTHTTSLPARKNGQRQFLSLRIPGCNESIPLRYKGVPTNLQMLSQSQTPLNELNSSWAVNPVDSVQHKKVPCLDATRSLRFGILSWVIPVGIFLTVLIEVGNTISATSILHYAIIFGGIMGVVLGLLAIIFASIALNKSADEPKKYSGMGKAAVGLTLGILALLAFLVILIEI